MPALMKPSRTARAPVERRMPRFRPWAGVAWLAVFAGVLAIFFAWRNPEMRMVDVEALLPGFYTHTSNLLLSFALVVAYGMVRLVYRARFVELVGFGLLVVAANYGYEGLLTLWNTMDLVDAHYGAVAVALALAFLALLQRHGLVWAAEPTQVQSTS